MGLQDKLADARKAAERARAQQQEWSQGRHEAKEQQAVARQETEAQEKARLTPGWRRRAGGLTPMPSRRSGVRVRCQ